MSETVNEAREALSGSELQELWASLAPEARLEAFKALSRAEAEDFFGQVRAGLDGRSAEQVGSLVIAYEPIWAIGTGRTATADDAQAVCAAIRRTVADGWGADAAEAVRIQYGGSVKAGNTAELMACPDVDGALVGGASLDADEFARIVQLAAT